MRASGSNTLIVTPGGPTEFGVDTTDVNGRVAFQIRNGGRAGQWGLGFRARGASVLSIPVNTLPGAPARLQLVPDIVRTLPAKRFQLRTFAFDRRNNPLGDFPAAYEVVEGKSVASVNSVGAGLGREFGIAIIRSTTAIGAANTEVRVFPEIRVAGTAQPFSPTTVAPGSLVTGFLDGSDIGPVGAVKAFDSGSEVDWSPDASLIALEGVYPGASPTDRHIFLARLDGKSEPLTPEFQNSAGEFGPRFSPNGEFVYFSKRTAGGGAELWRARLSTRAVERIGPATTENAHRYPSFSPDGRSVLFIRNTPQHGTALGDVVIVDLATGNLTDTGIDAVHAEWSPTSDRLAVMTRNQNVWELSIVQRDGTLIRKLGTAGSASSDPGGVLTSFDWSVDGRYILTEFAVIDVDSGVTVPTSSDVLRRSWRPLP